MILQLLTITTLLPRDKGSALAPFSAYIYVTEAHMPPGKNAWHRALLELYLPLHPVADWCCPV